MKDSIVWPVLLAIFIVAVITLNGCSSMPSMRYCEKVEYKREGSKILINAECNAPVGVTTPL